MVGLGLSGLGLSGAGLDVAGVVPAAPAVFVDRGELVEPVAGRGGLAGFAIGRGGWVVSAGR